MMMKNLAASLCLAMAAATGSAVASDETVEAAKREYDLALDKTPDLENGKRLYLTCAVCHLPEGWGTEDGTYPQIAGQLNTVIIKQLADIRARKRDNPIMYPFSVPRIFGGAQEIADVAAYISALPMTPHNGLGPGRELVLGEKLYRDNCVECHGKHGEGDKGEHIPALWGQHFRYLVRQFGSIKLGKRRNADPKMQKQIKTFSTRDTHAVMDYTSRLRPPEDRVAESANWHNPDFPNYVRPPMPLPPPDI